MCAKCGLIFTRKFTDTNFYYEFINTYYGMAGYPPSDEVLELQLEKYKKIKQLITPIKTKNFFKPLKFLEVSSFYGVGLKQFSKQFDVTGIEPAYLAAKFSAEDTLLKNKVINDTYENSLHLLEKYDLVLFTHSFRQIADQQLLLDSLPKILTKNGIIAITEGCFSDFIFCESFNSNRMHFSQYKSAYWNSINLQIAMGLRGFEIIDLAFFPELNKSSSPFSIAIFRFSGKLFNTSLYDESLNLSKRIIAHHKKALSGLQNSST